MVHSNWRTQRLQIHHDTREDTLEIVSFVNFNGYDYRRNVSSTFRAIHAEVTDRKNYDDHHFLD